MKLSTYLMIINEEVAPHNVLIAHTHVEERVSG
jgi:hypothetical protein